MLTQPGEHRVDLDQSVDQRVDDADQRCQPEPPAHSKQGQSAVIGDPAMTLAAVDRLVHHATIFEINVDSYRRRAALERKHRGAGRPPNYATINDSSALSLRDNQTQT